MHPDHCPARGAVPEFGDWACSNALRCVRTRLMSRLVRLTDEQWARVSERLPSTSKTGGRNAKPHRPIVEAMIWILRTGAPWRDLPSSYGPWQSVYTRFSRWSASGVFASLFEALAREHDGESYLIDATIVRAHQDASGAAKKGGTRNWALTRRSVHKDPRRRRCAWQPGVPDWTESTQWTESKEVYGAKRSEARSLARADTRDEARL